MAKYYGIKYNVLINILRIFIGMETLNNWISLLLRNNEFLWQVVLIFPIINILEMAGGLLWSISARLWGISSSDRVQLAGNLINAADVLLASEGTSKFLQTVR